MKRGRGLLWVGLAVTGLLVVAVLFAREMRTRKEMGAYMSEAVKSVEIWKVEWHRAEDTDVRELVEAVERLDATRTAFLAVDPPAEAWEFHQAMAYAMDSSIELCLAFMARADTSVVAGKRAAASEYSKAAAEASETWVEVYARWMVD